MTDTSELTSKLRNIAANYKGIIGVESQNVLTNSATTIEAKDAEIARLREALKIILSIHKAHFGRQSEKLSDIRPIALAALTPPEGEAS